MNERVGRHNDEARIMNCELCIVGAGIAGLNALFVASRYLKRTDKVILLDRKPTLGGMWNDTYDYVRLHQPHSMFTVGNIKWNIGKDPSYLATRFEILAHFKRCVDLLRERVELVELYDHDYLTHREVPSDYGYEAEIDVRSLSDGRHLSIRAKRCIKAFGANVPVNEPIRFSSNSVRSLAPHQGTLLSDEMRNSDNPVYVIGGGKTGMDTAYELLKRFPGKRVHIVVGEGTVFSNRNLFFPEGLKRWWKGKSMFGMYLDLTLIFDGDNEEEIFERMKADYTVSLRPNFKRHMYGSLSEEENSFIANGASSVIPDYLEDVVDESHGPMMVFRSGRRVATERGSWIVNCTGYVARHKTMYEPYLSANGTVVSIQMTSTIALLPSFSAYYMVHLFYMNQLDKLPLYELNQIELRRKNPKASVFTDLMLTIYNLTLAVDVLPMSVVHDCGLDFERWYPIHRRLAVVWKLSRNKQKLLRHSRTVLDRVREKYQVKCGLLESVAQRQYRSERI